MSIDTAYFKRNGLIELLNYLSKNVNQVKAVISSGGNGGGAGADIPSIQAAIEDGTLTTINTKKLRIYAEQMMPTAANSMYFLQSDINPSQIADPNVVQYTYFRIADNGSIPVGDFTMKAKFAINGTDAGAGNMFYGIKAGWGGASPTNITYGAERTQLASNNNAVGYVLTALTDDIAIGGTRGTDGNLYFMVSRLATDFFDDYAASSKLTFVDVEFVMAQ